MTGVHAKAGIQSGLGRCGEALQLVFLIGSAPGGGIGLGVQLDPVRACGFGSCHGGCVCVHEEADPRSQRLRLCDQGPQGRLVGRKIPSMVAGELPLAIRHKSQLVHRQAARADVAGAFQQVVQRVAFDVELAVRPIAHQLGQVHHVMGADMARVRARMHRDTRRTGLQAQSRCAGQARYAQMPGVAHQRDFVEVDRQGDAVGAHRAWRG